MARHDTAHFNAMKQRFLALSILVLFLASCASLLGPREVEIPLSRLQTAVSTKFPFKNRFLELIDVNLTNPRLALQPESNRILTTMDAAVMPPFINRSWTGNFTVSGVLRFDATRNALVLAEPRMEKFNIDGLDGRYASQLAKIGSLVTEQFLDNTPLYTFKPEDLRYGGRNFVLSKITTKPDSLVVTFEPVK
jgi:hypothetical protein